jgi:hypothetical protein
VRFACWRAEEGISISAFLAARLEQIVRERKTYERARKRALARLREGLQWTLPIPVTNFMSDELCRINTS